jgi:hypothetical protein
MTEFGELAMKWAFWGCFRILCIHFDEKIQIFDEKLQKAFLDLV